MRCMVCGAEMILTKVVQDDTMEVAGFDHHTFTCSECQDVEERLVFTKQNRESDTEPMLASGTVSADTEVHPDISTA
jgi:hypothetical protein